MLTPITFFVSIMLTIFLFLKVFDLIYTMTEGGPGRSTNVLVMHIYQSAFTEYKFWICQCGGHGTFCNVLVITLIQLPGREKVVRLYVEKGEMVINMKIKLRPLLAKVLIYILLIGISLIMLIPFAWMLTSSFKMNKDVFTYPVVWWPKEFITSNYVRIWEEIPLLRYFFNTSKLTVLITILQLLTSTFAAYAFAKMKFPGKDFLFLSYICTIAMPWQSYMIPQFIIIKKMGLVNTHLALIILQSFTAFGVFLVRQFYMEIPNEICEAARIDGMSEYGIYAKIMLPLSKPVIATLTIFSFTTIWNDFYGSPYLH